MSAIVLAGGRSSRYGADKLAVLIDGRPLLHHAISAVAQVADEVVVVAAAPAPAEPADAVSPDPDDPPTPAPPAVPPATAGSAGHATAGLPWSSVPLRIIQDVDPFRGPLAGLRDGARAARRATLLVVGGDMPLLVPGVLRLLVGAVGDGVEAATLGARSVDAQPPILPFAASRVAATLAIDTLLAADRGALRGLLEVLRTTSVAAARWQSLDPEGRTLHDVDRPEDLPGP